MHKDIQILHQYNNFGILRKKVFLNKQFYSARLFISPPPPTIYIYIYIFANEFLSNSFIHSEAAFQYFMNKLIQIILPLQEADHNISVGGGIPLFINFNV